MEQLTVSKQIYTQQIIHTGRPDIPIASDKPFYDLKRVDPSSSTKGGRCPIPSLFEYRVRPTEFDYNQ